MKNLTFDMADYPSLSINGHEFEVQMSDVEILQLANDIGKKYESLTTGTHSAEEILSAVKEVTEGIDQILGAGAVSKLAEGKPVSISTAIRLMQFVSQNAIAVYAERLADMYE